MKNPTTKILAGGLVALFATAAWAATAVSVKDMPDGSGVSLSGTVENFDGKHGFTLRDSTGTVKIDLGSAKSVVLENGEEVTVDGTIDKGLLGSKVVAREVSENKGVGTQVGEAIDSATGSDIGGSARKVRISALPQSGLVRVDGTVEDVDSEKQFTLKDQTGHVDVDIRPGIAASLNKGTEVAVTGYVNSGILGKSIDAAKVDIISDQPPPVAAD